MKTEKGQEKNPNEIPLKHAGKDTFWPEDFKPPVSTTNPLEVCSAVN